MPRPNTMPNQSMPIGLLSKEPRLRHRLVKSAFCTVGWMTFTFCWMAAIILLQPPTWIRPRMGIKSEPSQIRKNCNTSLNTAESRPPSVT